MSQWISAICSNNISVRQCLSVGTIKALLLFFFFREFTILQWRELKQTVEPEHTCPRLRHTHDNNSKHINMKHLKWHDEWEYEQVRLKTLDNLTCTYAARTWWVHYRWGEEWHMYRLNNNNNYDTCVIEMLHCRESFFYLFNPGRDILWK